MRLRIVVRATDLPAATGGRCRADDPTVGHLVVPAVSPPTATL